jgi:hypothetical protein
VTRPFSNRVHHWVCRIALVANPYAETLCPFDTTGFLRLGPAQKANIGGFIGEASTAAKRTLMVEGAMFSCSRKKW